MELFVTVCWIILGMVVISIFGSILRFISRLSKQTPKSNRNASGNYKSKNTVSKGKSIICFYCGQENKYGEIYCSKCGQKLDYSKKCKKCNGLNEPNATHCTYCGEKFDE